MRPRFLFLLLLAAPASAEGPVSWSLAETLERARAHSARLQQLAAYEHAAGAAERAARAARLPQVDVSASYTRNSNVPELEIVFPGPPPTRQTVFPNIPDNYRARIGLSLPLYTGGRLAGEIAAAGDLRAAAAKDREGGDQDLILEATTAYWGLVNARQSALVFSRAIASYEAHLVDARNRLELGLAARNDLLGVQVERDRAELSRLEAVNRAEIANANLVRLVGLAPDARIEPTEPLLTPGARDEGIESLVSAAAAGRPDIAALKARIAAADANTKVARSASLPQISLSAGYDYARPNQRILPLVDRWNDTWSVGLSLSLTAFDGGRTAASAAQARAQADALRHQLEDLIRRLRLEVKSRALDLTTARAQIAVAERNLEAAKENVRVLQDRYHEGLSPSFELLDAETQLLRADLDRTLAATGVQVARAELDRAVGR